MIDFACMWRKLYFFGCLCLLSTRGEYRNRSMHTTEQIVSLSEYLDRIFIARTVIYAFIPGTCRIDLLSRSSLHHQHYGSISSIPSCLLPSKASPLLYRLSRHCSLLSASSLPPLRSDHHVQLFFTPHARTRLYLRRTKRRPRDLGRTEGCPTGCKDQTGSGWAALLVQAGEGEIGDTWRREDGMHRVRAGSVSADWVGPGLLSIEHHTAQTFAS